MICLREVLDLQGMSPQPGDCVERGDNGGDDTEWRNATNALYRLETPIDSARMFGIPYGLSPGNHDLSAISSGSPTSVFYNQYFGIDHFAGRDYYGGHFGTNNNNHFEIFSVSGLDFMVIHLEYDTSPDPAVLECLRHSRPHGWPVPRQPPVIPSHRT